ncbi:MAG: aspartate carbamoyltransferase regulatory subunit [Clostridiales Family XIII bacterium]|jgi:aspartate carbamoyltransferase regulatory subunit|nr:aspartate carbamoyltransferase regulatory subunit [Clostridiales Family XIII bacterium]
MVVINSIAKGIVIDHIRAGNGMRVLAHLNIDTSRNTVAFIMNAASKKHGRKDLIKIENITDVDLTVLGLIDHNATVNIIEDHIIAEKIKLRLPETVTDVIKCRNPRCVASSEAGISHIFRLVDEDAKEYRCEYCDDIVKAGEY